MKQKNNYGPDNPHPDYKRGDAIGVVSMGYDPLCKLCTKKCKNPPFMKKCLAFNPKNKKALDSATNVLKRIIK
jgi:hypothetical protein